MSGWKKSLEQARLLEKEAIDNIDEELGRMDNPPSLDQTLEVVKMMEGAMTEALKVNGIERNIINTVRVASFNLASLEYFHYSRANSTNKEIDKDVVRAATDNSLQNARRFMDEVDKGKDDE